MSVHPARPSDRLTSAARDARRDAGGILLVEDDAAYASLVAFALRSVAGGERLRIAARAADALLDLARGGFSLLVLDCRLPDGDGLEILRRLRSSGDGTPAVMLTADASPSRIVEAMRAGATDYLVKSASSVERLAAMVAALAEGRAGSREARTRRGLDALVGDSAVMCRLRGVIARCAGSAASVLIEGETGAGKELVARALHEEGARADGPFVAVNCGALPEHLVESELFGHVRGAFTGAHRDHAGLVEAAAGGTLFLDEIEDLPLALQGKLLRLLQEAEYRPVGATRAKPADVRVVAAGNVDLLALVEEHRFRRDLYYRLNVLRVSVPPLRERREDVGALLAHFAAQRSARGECGRAPRGQRGDAVQLAGGDLPIVPMPDEDVVALLEGHDWPGNVRELQNLVERADAVAAHVGWSAAWALTAGELLAEAARTGAPAALRDLCATVLQDVREDRPAGLGSGSGAAVPDAARAEEARALRLTLERHRWRREAAARALGISRVTLWRRMRRLGLCDEPPPTAGQG